MILMILSKFFQMILKLSKKGDKEITINLQIFFNKEDILMIYHKDIKMLYQINMEIF